MPMSAAAQMNAIQHHLMLVNAVLAEHHSSVAVHCSKQLICSTQNMFHFTKIILTKFKYARLTLICICNLMNVTDTLLLQ